MVRRALLIATVVAVGLVAVFAVPQSRHAISDLFGSAGTAAANKPGGSGGGSGLPGTVIQPAPVGPHLAAPADPASVKASGTTLFEWAFLDRGTGEITGSKGYTSKTDTVESMIKPGIVGDWLRRQAEAGTEPTQKNLDEITRTIIDSVDTTAQKYYNLGGGVAVINRLVDRCGLTNVGFDAQGRWSWMEFTPQDSLRYAQCLADGRVAGPKWTTWLLDLMKRVRGELSTDHSHDGEGGRWGIIDGLPPELAKDTSIKNGWTPYHSTGWHVNCMAIHPDFILVIEMHSAQLPNAANVCETTAAKFVVNPS